jgi:NAD(P)-dependent dehydrogenase (short-subunit alcohol dehydrogenase family)
MDAPVHVILGGTGGIGSALARRLVAADARILLAARNQDRLDALGRELGAETAVVDATDPEQVRTAVRQAVATYGRLDGVANCVGSIVLKPAHRTSPEEWREVLDLNLGTAFAAVRAGAEAMQKTGGSIVLVSSAAARLGLANHEAVAAAKAGVIGLTLSAAATYAPRGIRVNCVAPGLVRTPMSAGITGNEIALKASASMHALGRIGEPDEVAAALVWLLDPAQGWVTGQVLGVDGGLATVRARGSA